MLKLKSKKLEFKSPPIETVKINEHSLINYQMSAKRLLVLLRQLLDKFSTTP